jgi:hypothetical protein
MSYSKESHSTAEPEPAPVAAEMQPQAEPPDRRTRITRPIDIPNAFVQTKLENEEDKAIMRLRGKLAELMVKVTPEVYRKYIHTLTEKQFCT